MTPQHRDLKPITVYLPEAVVDWLQARAKAEDRHVSYAARQILVKAHADDQA